ncbi:MAG: sulfite exporter TauE/SafE family protein [Rhodocyclaceae bacterium]|nr:sulfite exporter TauE/SafE family protein [Rhodocyclaceae bacterium]
MLEELAAGQVTLATVWLLGVSMGLTACTVTCLPFMGTWALGRASGQREAFLHTGVFLAGRVTTYTILAALAGAVGLGLAQALGGTWGNAVIGGASILAGLWLLARPAGKACATAPRYAAGTADAVPPAPTLLPPHARPTGISFGHNPGSLPPTGGASAWGGPAPTLLPPHARNPGSLPPTGGTSAWGGPTPTFRVVQVHRRKLDSLPPLFLGAALSLTPCMPLASLLALAANAGSATGGAAYGLAFGLGAAMTPILVLVPLAGRLGRELRAGRQWLARWLLWSAAAVLIVLGMRRLLLVL